jgi:NADP-dependent 3-hydroxy acid dehydrogenase YdfG
MQQRVVLITGTTSGIGRHAAGYLARRGHRVIATGRSATALAALHEETGGALDTVTLDVTDPASIVEAVAVVDSLTGGHGVDALVNNAGYASAAPLIEATDADVRGQFETNVFGLLAVTRAFVPKMLERRHGTVVNVSSIGGRLTLPFFGAYHGTKYAVEALSDALRLELELFGIRVVVVEPGAVRSQFAATSIRTVDGHTGPASRYAGPLAQANSMMARVESTGASPEVISRVFARAIEARRPAARYMAPFSVRVNLAMAAALPTRLLDRMLRRSTGLTSERLAEAAPARTR